MRSLALSLFYSSISSPTFHTLPHKHLPHTLLSPLPSCHRSIISPLSNYSPKLAARGVSAGLAGKWSGTKTAYHFPRRSTSTTELQAHFTCVFLTIRTHTPYPVAVRRSVILLSSLSCDDKINFPSPTIPYLNIPGNIKGNIAYTVAFTKRGGWKKKKK